MKRTMYLEEAVALVRDHRAAAELPVGSNILHGIDVFRVIGHDHDVNAKSPSSPTITVVRNVLVGYHRFHNGSCPDGWCDSELRRFLNNEVFNNLPDSLREVICPTIRVTYGDDGRMHETEDKLFIPNESEMFGSAIYSEQKCGEIYGAFETSRDRRFVGNYGEPWPYWLASPTYARENYFCCCGEFGEAKSSRTSYIHGVLLCFTIS